MREIDRALADISRIRSQVAAGTMFRGFGPAVMLVTGGFAIVTALAQWIWPETLAGDPGTFLICWIVTALVSAGLIGWEMFARSRRHHGGLADTMVLNAVEQLLPAGFAGAAIAGVLFKFSPDALWMVPGLWQVCVAIGVFTAIHMLPRMIVLVGAWYFIAGIVVMIVASFNQTLSPWMMGVPFAVGQFIMAVVLHFATGDDDAEA